MQKLSPLYEYWNSDQEDQQENKRLLKLNSKEPASCLFRNEPYKWENIYQSVLRNVIGGDETSIKGLMVLLSRIHKKEKEKTLFVLEDLSDNSVIHKLSNERYQDIKTSKKCFYFIKNIFEYFYKSFWTRD